MLKTVIVLPDGTELYSGAGEINNIRSATITECVNSDTELTLGSVCAAVAEVQLQTPYGGLSIKEGTEIALYKEDDSGSRHKIGLFTMEKPQRPSANIYNITAYDRISWLDKDLTEWILELDAWPYTVLDFAHKVAQACGLTLKNTNLLNGDYLIRAFSGQGITGRKLMEWIGQICAKFCRATADGDIEFSWYTNKYNITIAPSSFLQDGAGYEVAYIDDNLSITSPAVDSSDDGTGNVTIAGLAVVSDDGDGNLVLGVDDGQRTGIGFFQGGLSYEDYVTAPIEKVQIRLTDDDIGAVYPQATGEVNTYIITGNYLLTTDDAAALQGVAEGIYNAISNVRYTPCKVSIPANLLLSAGDIVQISDTNGKSITSYIMARTQTGQRDTLESTGSARRDSSTAVNNESFKSLSGTMFEVRRSIDGLRMRASEIEATTNERFAEVELNAEGLAVAVSDVENSVAQNALEVATVKQRITSVKQTAENVNIRVQSIIDNGVSKVTTSMGYTFNDDGLHIEKDGDEVANRVDNTGMYVARSGETIFKAGAAGVDATDVTVHNYLIFGNHARFEAYSDGTDTKRVGCFFI